MGARGRAHRTRRRARSSRDRSRSTTRQNQAVHRTPGYPRARPARRATELHHTEASAVPKQPVALGVERQARIPGTAAESDSERRSDRRPRSPLRSRAACKSRDWSSRALALHVDLTDGCEHGLPPAHSLVVEQLGEQLEPSGESNTCFTLAGTAMVKRQELALADEIDRDPERRAPGPAVVDARIGHLSSLQARDGAQGRLRPWPPARAGLQTAPAQRTQLVAMTSFVVTADDTGYFPSCRADPCGNLRKMPAGLAGALGEHVSPGRSCPAARCSPARTRRASSAHRPRAVGVRIAVTQGVQRLQPRPRPGHGTAVLTLPDVDCLVR